MTEETFDSPCSAVLRRARIEDDKYYLELVSSIIRDRSIGDFIISLSDCLQSKSSGDVIEDYLNCSRAYQMLNEPNGFDLFRIIIMLLRKPIPRTNFVIDLANCIRKDGKIYPSVSQQSLMNLCSGEGK